MSSASLLTAAHRERAAYVYVRQSSELQAGTTRRLQYALEDHAKELGFRDVTVIDDDLRVSGAFSLRRMTVSISAAAARASLTFMVPIWPTIFQMRSPRCWQWMKNCLPPRTTRGRRSFSACRRGLRGLSCGV